MKTRVEQKDFEAYLQEARSWETDKVRELTQSRRTAWRVASAASLLAGLLGVAVVAMLPLKTVEPYVIKEDRSTGTVEVIKAMKEGTVTYDEAMNKFFTQWYVRYREGYSKELSEDYYNSVGLMSETSEQQRYYRWFQPQNPASPLNVYGNRARVRISIKGTSFISPTVALVRYTKSVEQGADTTQVSHWAATITFRYTGAPMKEGDRGINPLGFQVIEYRNDPEASPTDAAMAPALPAVSAMQTAVPTVMQ